MECVTHDFCKQNPTQWPAININNANEWDSTGKMKLKLIRALRQRWWHCESGWMSDQQTEKQIFFANELILCRWCDLWVAILQQPLSVWQIDIIIKSQCRSFNLLRNRLRRWRRSGLNLIIIIICIHVLPGACGSLIVGSNRFFVHWFMIFQLSVYHKITNDFFLLFLFFIRWWLNFNSVDDWIWWFYFIQIELRPFLNE